jgi:hypothetical protein
MLGAAAPPERKGTGAGGPDWQNEVITATGAGAPDLHAPSPAAARLGAEHAAQLDALRNILTKVKGVQVAGGQSVGDKMSSDPSLSGQVEGSVKNFKVTAKRYFNDGGVEVDVEVRMADVLSMLVPASTAVASVPSTGTATNSGLVVDAKALKVQPGLEPRIVDEAGKAVYGPEVVTADWMKKQGVAAYLKSVDDAKKSDRVGSKPLVVKAVKANGTDVVISTKDADALRDPKTNVSYLSEGRVIIVTD